MNPKSQPLRVMIVDDHPITRDGLAQLIDREPDLTVAWQAQTAGEALHIVAREQPDLAVVDITLPDKSGVELIKDLRAFCPRLYILVLSMHDESLYAERALRAGARGYLNKSEGGARMMQAIRQILAGQIFVSEKTSARILENYSCRSETPGRPAVEQLSDREFEIFQFIGQGLSTAEIGDRLCISGKTVETHRMNIKAKLGVGSASELIAFAARWCTASTTAPPSGKRGLSLPPGDGATSRVPSRGASRSGPASGFS